MAAPSNMTFDFPIMKPRALRISLLLLPALLLGGACSRSALPEKGPTLSVQIRTEDTRSGTYAFDTDAVHSLSVFVFLPNGSLENSGRSSGSRLTLALSRGGGKRIFVLANAPAEVDACTSEAQLRAIRTTLADQASGHFAMAWKSTEWSEGFSSFAPSEAMRTRLR